MKLFWTPAFGAPRSWADVDAKLAKDLVDLMQKIRGLDLKKTPSISETLDWARALLALNAEVLDQELVSSTLSVILKYEGDIQKAKSDLGKLLEKPKQAEPSTAKTPPDNAKTKKGALH